jgi:hypothetical protein
MGEIPRLYIIAKTKNSKNPKLKAKISRPESQNEKRKLQNTHAYIIVFKYLSNSIKKQKNMA